MLFPLIEHLKADPARAQELRQCLKQGQQGLFKKIWPQYAYTTMFATGGFRHNAKILMRGILKDTMLFSPNHGASEGIFGANITPNQQDPVKVAYSAFVLLFQEYIPVSEKPEDDSVDSSQPQTLFPEQVKLRVSLDF